jgi:hypothetical protein
MKIIILATIIALAFSTGEILYGYAVTHVYVNGTTKALATCTATA